jgi:hypothetical protein
MTSSGTLAHLSIAGVQYLRLHSRHSVLVWLCVPGEDRVSDLVRTRFFRLPTFMQGAMQFVMVQWMSSAKHCAHASVSLMSFLMHATEHALAPRHLVAHASSFPWNVVHSRLNVARSSALLQSACTCARVSGGLFVFQKRGLFGFL